MAKIEGNIKNIIQEGELITRQRQEVIKNYNLWARKQESKGASKQLIFIEMRYIGKIKLFDEESGKELELNAFMSVEQIGDELQYVFCAQNEGETIHLGIKLEERPAAIGINFLSAKKEEQTKIVAELEKKWNERENTMTIEELEEKQEELEEKGEESEKTTEEQVLPGVDEQETILTKAQMDSLGGPKTRLGQMVNGRTLGESIGISGMYIQFVDADRAKKMCPEIEVKPGQKYVPFSNKADGSGTPIGDDKLSFSELEGENYSAENATITNDGKVTKEQNVQTFNINALGQMSASISIGYDEANVGMDQQEIKFEFRNPENPNQKVSVELESVHGDFGQSYVTQRYLENTEEGINRVANTIERAGNKGDNTIVENVDADPSNDTISGEDAKKYAEVMKIDDLGVARKCLEKAMRYNPGASLEEILEGDQHVVGPGT